MRKKLASSSSAVYYDPSGGNMIPINVDNTEELSTTDVLYANALSQDPYSNATVGRTVAVKNVSNSPFSVAAVLNNGQGTRTTVLVPSSDKDRTLHPNVRRGILPKEGEAIVGNGYFLDLEKESKKATSPYSSTSVLPYYLDTYDFVIIGRDTCPYTIKAYDHLTSLNSDFYYIRKSDGANFQNIFYSLKNYDDEDSREKLLLLNLMGKIPTYNKVPAVFYKEDGDYKFIGGYNELSEAFKL